VHRLKQPQDVATRLTVKFLQISLLKYCSHISDFRRDFFLKIWKTGTEHEFSFMMLLQRLLSWRTLCEILRRPYAFFTCWIKQHKIFNWVTFCFHL